MVGAVASGDVVELLFKPLLFVEVLEELVAPVQEFARCLVFWAGDARCGGQVVLGALDGGAGSLVVEVGGAQVLGPGQQLVERGDQGVGGGALVGGGDQEQFGVGGRGVAGGPLQLVGGQVVGVVDDHQVAEGQSAATGGQLAHVGEGFVSLDGCVGVEVG